MTKLHVYVGLKLPLSPTDIAQNGISLATGIGKEIADNLSSCERVSFCIDESTDRNDIRQLY